MWARAPGTPKWHRYKKGEDESNCRNARRPVEWVMAQEDGKQIHGQRATVPPRGEALCASCVSGAGFRRRAPRKLHMEKQELLDALDEIAAKVARLQERLRGDGP